MTDSERQAELQKLEERHKRGEISAFEFQDLKKKLMSAGT